ncbi:hypothetical protein BJ138DRAFT_1117824 [Hygrophoropsis aurantiaca]|uniref:Uncharacterized protein n=1 Tax=Hygrophoropsis aurantiaca TaxID=72124 RepID=A0ACB7ZY36_9AGAM|nr:hypothetical protein BJ138DRAFT_1117824 [Hygrophoropsis aurantiaca]
MSRRTQPVRRAFPPPRLLYAMRHSSPDRSDATSATEPDTTSAFASTAADATSTPASTPLRASAPEGADDDMASVRSENESSDVEVLEGMPPTWRNSIQSRQRRARAASDDEDVEFVDDFPVRSPKPPSMASILAAAQASGSLTVAFSKRATPASVVPPSMESILAANGHFCPQAGTPAVAASAGESAAEAASGSPAAVAAPRPPSSARSGSPELVRVIDDTVAQILESLGIPFPPLNTTALMGSPIHTGIDDLQTTIQFQYKALLEEIEELASMYRTNRQAMVNAEIMLENVVKKFHK